MKWNFSGNTPNDSGPESPDGRSERCASCADAERFKSEMATCLWRLKAKLIDPATGTARDETRGAYRHLTSALDLLSAEGVDVQDHTGSPFDGGQSLKVIAYQPTTGLERETVVETIRPTVYIGGRPVQLGEVIVGVPEAR